MSLSRYPGSKPFTSEYEGLFFGRDDDIDTVCKYIKTSAITVLFGKSGLGKTSLLNAGVLPRLAEHREYAILPVRFQNYVEGREETPLDIFSNRLTDEVPQQTFLNQIEPDRISLWQKAKNFAMTCPEAEHILLVFDQFEELFTWPDGINSFGEALARLLNNQVPKSFRRNLRRKASENPDIISEKEWDFIETPLNVKIVCSIRSDRLHLLNRLSEYFPQILQNSYELKPLTTTQAKLAITAPTSALGEYISPPFSYQDLALTELLSFLTQNNSQFIESFQLQVICQYIEETLVCHHNKRQIAAGDLEGLEMVYQNYYDSQIRQIQNEEEQKAAQILIEEGLIFEEEERRVSLDEGIIYRRYGVGKELIRKLVNTHLIRGERNSIGNLAYELSHDSLVAPILQSKERRKRNEIKEIEQRRRKRLGRNIIIGASLASVLIVGLTLGILNLSKLLSQSRENERRARGNLLVIQASELLKKQQFGQALDSLKKARQIHPNTDQVTTYLLGGFNQTKKENFYQEALGFFQEFREQKVFEDSTRLISIQAAKLMAENFQFELADAFREEARMAGVAEETLNQIALEAAFLATRVHDFDESLRIIQTQKNTVEGR